MSGIICDNVLTESERDMKIDKEFLKSLSPCTDRYRHFLEHHANFSGSLNDFLDLTNLDYDDKIWVAEKVLTKNQAISWAILCAESVVHIFEARYPKDKRLSNCINFLKTVKDFDNLTNAEKSEIKRHMSDAHAARHDAHASDAARAAHAVYCAAYAVYCAANYAVYAALLAAADTGEDANAAGNNQQELNIQFLRMACSL